MKQAPKTIGKAWGGSRAKTRGQAKPLFLDGEKSWVTRVNADGLDWLDWAVFVGKGYMHRDVRMMSEFSICKTHMGCRGISDSGASTGDGNLGSTVHCFSR